MTYSVVGVTALTLLVTLGFLWALPTSGPADPDRLALDAAGHALGTLGERLVAMAVVVSCLAAISGLVFSGSRIIFAMARRGWFPPHAGATSGGRVPRNAMLYLGGWASVLTFTGRYDELFTYAVVAVWLFAMLGGLAVIVVRHRHPNDTRPYEVPGYPYVPAVFGVASWALMLQTLWTSPVQALIGAILVLAGLPVYWYFGKRAEGNRA
jgi:APA family basic amino acid/polyamine antiporter